MTINFSKMDNVVKEAIRQFLPPETLGKSAATSKLFQTIMNEKGAWKKIAKKLNINPLSSDSAKSEVISRLMGNVAVAKHVFAKDPKISECKDPFQLNNLIQTELHSPSRQWIVLWNLVHQVNELIGAYNKTLTAHETPDQTKLDAVLLLLKEGVMQNADKTQWVDAFHGVQGYLWEGEQYLFQHFPIFQSLVTELMKSQKLTSFEKQEIMDINRGCLEALNENYPYNYMEAMINAGWKPSSLTFYTTYTRCPIDLSGTAKPIALRLKYATLLLKNATKQEKQLFLAELIERKIERNSISELNNIIQAGLGDCLRTTNFKLSADSFLFKDAESIYQYIHWPETEALILGKEIDSTITKDQAERRQNILNAIEREEKNVLEQLKNKGSKLTENETFIKQHVARLKQAAIV